MFQHSGIVNLLLVAGLLLGAAIGSFALRRVRSVDRNARPTLMLIGVICMTVALVCVIKIF